MSAARVYVSRQGRGLGHPEARGLIIRAVRTALKAEGVACDAIVSVMLTDEAGIREINRDMRGIDSATDVLSFPFSELTPGNFDEADCERDPESGALFLGDMAISLPHAVSQGREYGHGFERELSYLAVHSTLHLLGYDHLDEGKEKKAMRQREKKIMNLLGMAGE